MIAETYESSSQFTNLIWPAVLVLWSLQESQVNLQALPVFFVRIQFLLTIYYGGYYHASNAINVDNESSVHCANL